MSINIIETSFKWNGSLTYTNKPNKIVLHHAEAKSCTVADIHKWHLNNGWTGIGYHFFVRKDGTIYRGRPENTIGAHVSGANTNSLGICAEGSYMVEDMPQAQKHAIKDLIKYLDGKYGIMPIYGHKEVGASSCPGDKFPLEELKNRDKSEEVVTPNPSPSPSGNAFTKELQDECNIQGFRDKNGNKLVVDGLWGTLTESAVPLVIKGAKGNFTRLIQNRVGSKVDGIFGSDTETKVKSYQKANGLVVDGKVGKDTWKTMCK